MKLSWQWLQEFVDLPTAAPELVGDKLTLHTAELEEIIEKRSAFEKVILGKLSSVAPHPDAEKLSVAQFDLGSYGTKQIIFGKVHEVTIGEILPVATAGASLASGINIIENEIRGAKSQGMIADNLELGFKQEGLLRFTDEKLIGKSLPEVITALGDTLFDIDNKSLTHRPDLVGHRGFARELATIFDVKLTLPEPVIALPNHTNGLAVNIETKSCRRFCGLKIENIQVAPSDLETQMRLENLEVRAISNLVDITNAIMLEYGQPMHVFDADKVEGKIIVRQATAGEKIVALDGEEYELTPEDTVVADEVKALSVAGIMGGLDSSVTDQTTNIIFEVANWDPVAVRKSSQRLGLRSESSMRYEKSLDPEQCRKALLAATEKALEICPQAKVSSVLVDEYPQPNAPKTIKLSLQKLRSLSGIDIEYSQVEKILQHLGFVCQNEKDQLQIQVPSWRNTKDVSIAEDIIEEVVRIYGLDRVPTELPAFVVNPPVVNHTRKMQWQVREKCATLGYLETYLHSFVPTEAHQENMDDHVLIANPLSEECKYMRRDLWPQMLAKIESDLRQQKQVQFFELGKVYHPVADEVLPTETERILMMRASLETTENDDFFVVKADLESLLKQLSITDFEFVPTTKPAKHFHPAKTVSLMIEGEAVGQVGVLHPRYLPVKGTSLVMAEIDLVPLCRDTTEQKVVHHKLSPFPAVHRDISLILDDKAFSADLIKTAQAASSMLTKIMLFDEYKDAQKIGEGLKNLAFHLSFQAPDRTLTEAEIELELNRVLEQLEQAHGAKLRLV